MIDPELREAIADILGRHVPADEPVDITITELRELVRRTPPRVPDGGMDVRLQPGEHIVVVGTPKTGGQIGCLLFGDAWQDQTMQGDWSTLPRLTLHIARAQLAAALSELDEKIARTEPTRLSHTEGARS